MRPLSTNTTGKSRSMNELYILNVGRADCIVMLLDTPQRRKCIVMDAGSCTYQGKTPLLTLRSKGICEVDLAILTHLHQDHFGGFHQLIGQIPIKKLLTPCGDLVFTKRIYPLFGDREYYREYHQIFSYLADCGTELCFPKDYTGRTFVYGNCGLQCLFTKMSSAMESVLCAKLLCSSSLSDDEIAKLLERYKQACNADSSIWALQQGREVIALLGGDSTDQSMQLALDRVGTFHPIVQKLSHHGLGNSYFSAEIQARLKPGTLVVSTDSVHCDETVQERVSALCKAGDSKLHYTFHGDYSLAF